MIIDIHTHTFPDGIAARTLEKLRGMSHTRTFSDGTAAGLRASMEAAGVDRSVVLPVATSPRQVVHVNDASARINETGDETGVYSFGCMHPDFDGWKEELSRVADLAVVDMLYMAILLSDYERFSHNLDRSDQVIADRDYPDQ